MAHPADTAAASRNAGIGRRLLSLAYEAMLVTALVLAGSIPIVVLSELLGLPQARLLLQLWLVLLCGAYFVWQWRRGGQTLAMKTWRLRLVMPDGGSVDTRRAALRYAAALVGTLAAGAGFVWAIVDRDRQFLHDRIAGTRIIDLR